MAVKEHKWNVKNGMPLFLIALIRFSCLIGYRKLLRTVTSFSTYVRGRVFENLACEMYSRRHHPNIKNLLIDDLRFKLFFQREGRISRYNSKCL